MADEHRPLAWAQEWWRIGGIIAVAASWERNHSILFALLHFFASWAYLLYYCFGPRK